VTIYLFIYVFIIDIVHTVHTVCKKVFKNNITIIINHQKKAKTENNTDIKHHRKLGKKIYCSNFIKFTHEYTNRP